MLPSSRRTDYWQYYNPDYAWDDDNGVADFIGSRELSEEEFANGGFSAEETEALLSSGYSAFFGRVIDRYYGGLLQSVDGRTRFAIKEFRQAFSGATNNVPAYPAKSIEDLRNCVNRWQSSTRRRMLFRGQIAAYSVTRPRPNPFFQVAGFGEVSLLPSIWRRMIAARPPARQNFRNLHILEWLRVIRSTFDPNEVKRRIEAARGAGRWMNSSQDLEESNDPLLIKLGRFERDIIMGMDFNLATPLVTLLQHYGLLSPVLDLTSDLDVALFFATNRYQPGSDGQFCSYTNVGTNGRRSVLYVIRENKTEMEVHERDRVLEDLDPLRPKRQSCVVCRSSPDAMNLAVDFLEGIITLDFDDVPCCMEPLIYSRGSMKTGSCKP